MNSLVLRGLVKVVPFAMTAFTILLMAHGLHTVAHGLHVAPHGDPGGPGEPNVHMISSGDPGGPGEPN